MNEFPMQSRQHDHPRRLLLAALVVSSLLHLLLFATAHPVREPLALPALRIERTIRIQLRANQGARRALSENTAPTQATGPVTARQRPPSAAHPVIRRDKQRLRRRPRAYRRRLQAKRPHRHSPGAWGHAAPTSHTAAGGDSPPRYSLGSADNPYPPYPYLARKHGWKGRVVLRVRVSSTGKPLRVTIARPSGYRVLDRSARTTIAKWKFKPSRRGGRATEASILVPVRFILK